ncbi:MAG: ribbon-helix-helix domain-containing protein [Victivallaceae bacterium]
MEKKPRYGVITFKVDDALREAMEGINNRSEFIRAAILAAMDNMCPLCKGTGILNPHQLTHWKEFRKQHPLEKCDNCETWHLSCNKKNS